MTHSKAVYKFKNGEEKVEMKTCNPRRLPLSCRYIAPYWFQAIQNVYHYKKRRDLREVHKLVSDDRIKKGLQLYREGKIIENTVTKANGGDVHAVIESENKKEQYTVIIKNYLPERPPQYVHEREEYIANLFVDCTCKDFSMGKYRDNASVFCKHVCAVLWFLINRFNMPKIFISPEERIVGFKKSKSLEIETEIEALPLVKFTQYMNILALERYRDMPTSLAISIHTIDNKTHGEYRKPAWLTYTKPEDAARIGKGIFEAYKKMMIDRGYQDEDIQKNIQHLLGFPEEEPKKESLKERMKKWWKSN